MLLNTLNCIFMIYHLAAGSFAWWKTYTRQSNPRLWGHWKYRGDDWEHVEEVSTAKSCYKVQAVFWFANIHYKLWSTCETATENLMQAVLWLCHCTQHVHGHSCFLLSLWHDIKISETASEFLKFFFKWSEWISFREHRLLSRYLPRAYWLLYNSLDLTSTRKNM